MGDYDQAKAYFEEALLVMKNLDQYGQIVDVKSTLGRLYCIMGECEKGLNLMEETLKEANSPGLRRNRKDHLYALFESYQACGDNDNAIYYLKEYMTLKDSIDKESNLEELAILNSTNQLHHKRKEVELLKNEKKLQTLYAYILGGTVLISLFIITFSIWSLKKQRKQNVLLETNNETIETQNQKLNTTVKQLTRANEELKQFAYVVSHDLKAPLRGISSLATFIEEDLTEDLTQDIVDEIDANLGLLKGRILRMENLINGILEYSRIGRKKDQKEEIDLNEFVANLIDSLVPDDHVEIQIINPLPKIYSTKTGIQQIFQNILSNAINYNDKEKCEIKIDNKNLKNFYKFSISDNGPGIAKEYHEKVFGIFQTLQPRDFYESTGVGLSIVKKQIENLGGEIWITSKEGEGATFHFTIKKSTHK